MSFWLLIIIGGICAGFIQGLSGFGFGLVSLAIWSWVLAPETAVPVVVAGSLVGQLLATRSLRKSIDVHKATPFLIGGALGLPFGLWLLSLMSPLLFKFIVGLLLCFYCLAMLLLNKDRQWAWGGRFADGLMGWLGGVSSGFGGIPGALPTLWCNLRGWSKHQQRSVFLLFNLFMHTITFASFLALGLINREVIKIIIVVIPSILIPTAIGIHLYSRFSDQAFKFVVLSLLLCSGLLLVFSTVPKIFTF